MSESPISTGHTSTGQVVEQSGTGVPRPSVLRVLRDQRKIIGVGVAMMVACYWVLGQLGEWETAAMTTVGVGLGLVNQLVTELWLARLISSGREVTRARITTFTIVRLVLLSVVAVGIAVMFWPSGIGLLLGLAIFRLIALVMTTIPLLKELKAQ